MNDSLKISGCNAFSNNCLVQNLSPSFFSPPFHKGPSEGLFSVGVVQTEAEYNPGWSLSAARKGSSGIAGISGSFWSIILTSGDDCLSILLFCFFKNYTKYCPMAKINK